MELFPSLCRISNTNEVLNVAPEDRMKQSSGRSATKAQPLSELMYIKIQHPLQEAVSSSEKRSEDRHHYVRCVLYLACWVKQNLWLITISP